MPPKRACDVCYKRKHVQELSRRVELLERSLASCDPADRHRSAEGSAQHSPWTAAVSETTGSPAVLSTTPATEPDDPVRASKLPDRPGPAPRSVPTPSSLASPFPVPAKKSPAVLNPHPGGPRT
ncbi:unnamed protein product [Parascedosporium putredinis]|uniref:Uncharacterized protein n=1 Tax=Parascedosporium putredinis TaxID=1442378 RepID=A0A9P1MAE6_9PEZI|nr:unnamed protein product [Parascedosporium putredinis]CAI7993773.1 unnamed protein product [Parascedosporium putredinis]